jgi:hypothetical protein
VRDAFSEVLPRVVLAEAHAEHVWFAGAGVQACLLQGAEVLEVVLEGEPGDFGAVFELGDVPD